MMKKYSSNIIMNVLKHCKDFYFILNIFLHNNVIAKSFSMIKHFQCFFQLKDENTPKKFQNKHSPKVVGVIFIIPFAPHC